MTDLVLLEVDGRGVARVTLNRPAVHNAFDDALIAELTAKLIDAGANAAVRVIVLAGAGKSFSAGADLNWMRRMSGYGMAENLRDAEALGTLLATLDLCPKPTLALVQGAVYGGGVGLVACCDVALASEAARFCLSEVRLGLVPATISPYVVRAMRARAARRYFQTAELFDAAEAHRIGLVHEVVAAEELEAAGERLIDALLQGGPQAQSAAKELIGLVEQKPIDGALISETARLIAKMRASDEGREGVGAFLDKRKPDWTGRE